MATRILHVSDLHFPAQDLRQLQALRAGVAAVAPHLVIVTGDITRRGRVHEFEAASDFLNGLSQQKLVVPGNHDIPVFAMLRRGSMRPFARFRAYVPHEMSVCVETPDAVAVGLNTASSARARFDWSLGHVRIGELHTVERVLASATPSKTRIVACHHPLLRASVDERRSRTENGREAFERLARSGMDVLMHGHLHRSIAVSVTAAGKSVRIIGATTALSERERGEGSGFNVVEIDRGHIEVRVWQWNGRDYSPL